MNPWNTAADSAWNALLVTSGSVCENFRCQIVPAVIATRAIKPSTANSDSKSTPTTIAAPSNPKLSPIKFFIKRSARPTEIRQESQSVLVESRRSAPIRRLVSRHWMSTSNRLNTAHETIIQWSPNVWDHDDRFLKTHIKNISSQRIENMLLSFEEINWDILLSTWSNTFVAPEYKVLSRSKSQNFIFFNSYMPHSYVHHKGKETEGAGVQSAVDCETAPWPWHDWAVVDAEI